MSYGVKRTTTLIHTSFYLTKKITFNNRIELDAMIEKLDRLKTENFNRVLIPDYKYERIDDNVLIYEVEFIKGFPVGTAVEPYKSMVYQDVLERESDWTFSDYHLTNFIVETTTDKLYAVDFQSYSYLPDRSVRKNMWHDSQQTHRKIFEGIMNNKWIKPKINYPH